MTGLTPTKCLFCTESIFPYTVKFAEKSKISEKGGNIPTFSTLCDCLQLNREEGSSTTTTGRKLVLEKLDSYYGNEEEEISGVTGCNTFLCLSCFERVDYLFKLHEQLKEIEEKIRESRTGMGELLGTPYRGERDREFLEVLEKFRTFVREHRISEGESGTRPKIVKVTIQRLIVEPDDEDDDEYNEDYDNATDDVADDGDLLSDDGSKDDPKEQATKTEKLKDPLESDYDSSADAREDDEMEYVSSSKFDNIEDDDDEYYAPTSSKREKIAKQKMSSTPKKTPGKKKASQTSTSLTTNESAEGGKLVCPSCPETSLRRFKSQLSLRNHIKAKHTSDEEKNIRCDHCGAGFMSTAVLRRHLMKVHNLNRMICTYCSKTFVSEGHFKDHLFLHELAGGGPAVVKCHYCDKLLTSTLALKNHIRTQHEETDPVQCESCGGTYKNALALRHHHGICREKMAKRVRCDQCDTDQFFKDVTFLENHKRAVHS